MRTVRALRYVTPLREGGSLPAIIEADDDGTYVLKFRGAGQGPKALIAELIAAEIGRALGLPLPECVLCELDPDLARTEPDYEISSLIRRSGGLNLALDYLPGSITYDPVVERLDPEVAARVVWFDAYLCNVDRTARNPNMLMWHRKLWLIDHGAALYFHHDPAWVQNAARARDPFPLIKDHVLLRTARRIDAVDADMAAAITPDVVGQVVSLIPQDWLVDAGGSDSAAPPLRAAYQRLLLDRAAAPRAFVEEAVRVR
jgi:hypothetical protein